MAWDKCEAMFKHLNKITWGYQFQAERKMFETEGPEYKCTLVRWERNITMRDNKRVVLVATSDPAQMEAALYMLINEAEAQAKANNVRSIE
jgi:hypothetical protein